MLPDAAGRSLKYTNNTYLCSCRMNTELLLLWLHYYPILIFFEHGNNFCVQIFSQNFKSIVTPTISWNWMKRTLQDATLQDAGGRCKTL